MNIFKTITIPFVIFLLFNSCSDDKSEPEPVINYYKPSVETSVTSSITEASASSGGFVSDDGGANVTSRGVCWSTTQDPTLNDNYTTDGTGTGTFVSLLAGLEEYTTYHVRAYATNSEGTNYGNNIEFTSLESGNVYHGDVLLRTQEEVNLFGANNYTKITGKLEIDAINFDPITDLTPLLALNTINDGLHIRDNDSLINLTGLNNITSVGGSLSINNCDNLVSLSGLNNIASVGGGLGISENNNLENLNPLYNITSINGSLTIIENLSLSNINGLSNITSTHYLSIDKNASLTNIDGLNNLSTVNGNLEILYNHSLLNVDGLSNLSTIDGIMYIFDNDIIENLNGFSNLTFVSHEGGIRIIHNDHLSDFCGLTNLFEIHGFDGYFEVWNNAYNPNSPISEENCNQ